MYATVHKSHSKVNGRTRSFSSTYCGFDVVAVAASAGGVEALISLLAVLPKDFPATLLVAQHLPPQARFKSRLDIVLQRSTRLHVKWAEDGELIRQGVVFLAPQDYNLTTDSTGVLHLVAGPSVNCVCPAADPLFSSVAAHFGARAIAVVLSGLLCDGAEGAWNVARQGGRVLIQDNSAAYPDMPRATLQAVGVDFMFSPVTLAHVLITLVSVPGASDWFRVWRSIPALFTRPALVRISLAAPN